MCGIAGFFGARHVNARALDAMRDAIKNRGPDASGAVFWNERDADWIECDRQSGPSRGLIHTRLSIRDLSHAADQPMPNDSKSIWICYNGEIYGWESDRQYLESEGFIFNTKSDTEFILKAYEYWGFDELLKKMRGMFSLVIYDCRIKKVFAVRDRMGLKPLVYYYNKRHKEFAFSSLVRGVLPYIPSAMRNFDAFGIDSFLAHRTIPAPRTAFTNISKLENAHYLVFSLDTGELYKKKYWDISVGPRSGECDWKSEFRYSLGLRTVSDRPVGLFLSGGIDSSLIACGLAELGYQNISTYTAKFSDPQYDESQVAEHVSSQLGLKNNKIEMPNNYEEFFENIVADLDEPFADPSSFPTWFLAKSVSRSVRVVLSGDGGDEMFAGYKRYRQHLKSSWRRFNYMRINFLRPSATPKLSKLDRLKLEASLDWRSAYVMRFSGISLSERLYIQEIEGLQPHYWRMSDQAKTMSPISQLLSIDIENYLPEYILRKADLLTMAHGLEARSPFLDHEFVKKVWCIPESKRFTSPPKKILSELCNKSDKLGVFGRKKMGFNPSTKGLVDAMSYRIHGLGDRLSEITSGQFSSRGIQTAIEQWKKDSKYDEKILQLIILDESLRQLCEVA